MAAIVQKAKKGKKQRKVGRNASYCKAYFLSRRREHNKIKRLMKRLARFPNDATAKAALMRCQDIIRGG